MAEKNILMQVRNLANTAWDTIYPKTKAKLVEFEDSTTVESHKDDDSIHFTKSSVSKSDVDLSNLDNHRQARSSDGYRIEKNGSDSDGIINFKTE